MDQLLVSTVVFWLLFICIINGIFPKGGIDYTSGPYSVTILAGAISASLNITINDDNIPELDETFEITINSSSPEGIMVASHTPGARAARAASSKTTAQIVDNDCKF